MNHHTTACLVALVLGLISFGLAGLSYWLGEALVPLRRLIAGGMMTITQEDHPFWVWSFIAVYTIIGFLFLYGGLNGWIRGGPR